MNRKKAYFYSLVIDAITLLIILGLGYFIPFLMNLHPLMEFLSIYDLGAVNQNPDLLPETSVLYSGIAFLAFLSIAGTLLALALFFKSRYLLFNKLVHNKFKHVKNITATKLILLQIPMLIIPLWFVLYVLTTIIIAIINRIPSETIVIFLQQLTLTAAISVALFILVEYSLFFYKKTAFFPNYPTFLKSLKIKKLGKVLGIVGIFFLVTFILQQLLANFYQLAFLESAYYYATSLILISIIRVETYLQK